MKFYNNPNGINYPDDPELRKYLADGIRKHQEHPARVEIVKQAENWSEYVQDIVRRVQNDIKGKKTEQ